MRTGVRSAQFTQVSGLSKHLSPDSMTLLFSPDDIMPWFFLKIATITNLLYKPQIMTEAEKNYMALES